jgi:hypothetical protein
VQSGQRLVLATAVVSIYGLDATGLTVDGAVQQQLGWWKRVWLCALLFETRMVLCIQVAVRLA